MRDYHRDLMYICIKRLYFAERMLDSYLSDGQNTDFFRSLELEGFNQDLRYPTLDYDDNEKECFEYICGKPLVLPKDFSNITPFQVKQMITIHRDKLRRIAGMIDNSYWLGNENYLCSKSIKNKYFTGRLIG